MNKKFISLGSNCCIAYCLRELNTREPSPVDWTDHLSIEDLFFMYKNIDCFDYILSKNKNRYIHENVITEYNKIFSRLSNLISNESCDYVYLIEKSEESNLHFILSLRQFCKNANQTVYIIDSSQSNEPDDFSKIVLHDNNIKYYKDFNFIFDANKLQYTECLNEMCKVLKEFLNG